MRVSAKADYAVRAALELAAAEHPPVKGERLAAAQSIPLKFLENIMLELRHAGIVMSQRGAVRGGYSLARPPDQIRLADVIRVVDGPLANVRGMSPERLEYTGAATCLRDVWVALRANMRAVLEAVTIDDLRRGVLPPEVMDLTRSPDAWVRR